MGVLADSVLVVDDDEGLRATVSVVLDSTALALLGSLGGVVGAVVTSGLGGGGCGNRLRYADAALCMAVLATIWLRRPSRRLYLGVFATLVVPILPLLVVWTLAVPEDRLSE